KTFGNRPPRSFPDTARGLRAELDRLVPTLRGYGFSFVFPTDETRTGHDRVRTLTVIRRPVAPIDVEEGLRLFFLAKEGEDRRDGPEGGSDAEDKAPEVRPDLADGREADRPLRSPNGVVVPPVAGEPPRPAAYRPPEPAAVPTRAKAANGAMVADAA